MLLSVTETLLWSPMARIASCVDAKTGQVALGRADEAGNYSASPLIGGGPDFTCQNEEMHWPVVPRAGQKRFRNWRGIPSANVHWLSLRSHRRVRAVHPHELIFTVWATLNNQ